MGQALRLHPDASCFAARHIEVEVVRARANRLVFGYVVTGSIHDLAIPAVVAAARTDELWRHTCFEAFVGSRVDFAYYEFNFAPSTQWAAFRFSSYRTGMRVANEISPPQITAESGGDRYMLQASVELDQLSLAGEIWRIGISAVIEEIGGHQSYWALSHPPGKADFHHSDCFAIEFRRDTRP